MTGIGWDMGLGGWLWMILGVVLLIAVIWAVMAMIPGRGRPTADDPAQILKTRFARGEISQEQYEQARRLLGI